MPDDDLRRATLKLLAEPHARDDDEDIHPAALDEADVELERALAEAHASPQVADKLKHAPDGRESHG